MIEILKSKGDRKVSDKVPAELAKEIYTDFLIGKNSHISEKESLALLIALKKKPPFVYDLVNTTRGWEIKGNKIR